MDPMLLAAALGDRSDAGEALQLGGALITLTLFTEGGEQARGESCTGTRQRSKQGVVGQGFAYAGDLGIKILDGLQRDAQLFDEGVSDQSIPTKTANSTSGCGFMISLPQ
jgi:hypothetical protein